MNGETLKQHAITLYGSRGWQTSLAAFLRVDVSSVRRWTGGQVAVPGPVAVAVELKLEADRKSVGVDRDLMAAPDFKN